MLVTSSRSQLFKFIFDAGYRIPPRKKQWKVPLLKFQDSWNQEAFHVTYVDVRNQELMIE